jgi:hypothetical protein
MALFPMIFPFVFYPTPTVYSGNINLGQSHLSLVVMPVKERVAISMVKTLSVNIQPKSTQIIAQTKIRGI